MTLQDIAERCSKFSGWNLTVEVKPGSVTFADPNDSTGQSKLVVSLAGLPGSQYLHEVYGRLRHWGITAEEQLVIKAALQAEAQETVDWERAKMRKSTRVSA